MRNRILCLSVIVVLFLSSGCASLILSQKGKLITAGRYSELEKVIESEMKDISSAASAELVGLCEAYAKLKKYSKLFSCAAQLEKNIQKGDRRAWEWRPFVGVTGGPYKDAGYFPSDITLIPYLLRAEAYIDLGDYGRSIEAAKRASELLPALDRSLFDGKHFNENRLIGTLALAYALNGDRENAQRYAEKLEDKGVGFVGAVPAKKEKQLILARIYMALGRFDKILANKGSIHDAFGKVGETLLLSRGLFSHLDLPRDFMIYKAYYETGHVREAKEGYDKLLGNPETAHNGGIYWPILFDRGRIAQREGHGGQTVEFYRKSIEVIEAQRSTINTEANRIGFVGDKQKVYHQMIAALYADHRHVQAFEYAERSKSRALVDLLASTQEFGASKNKEEISSMLKEIERVESEAQAIDMGSPVSDKAAQRSSRGVQIKERLKALAPELTSLVTVFPPPPSEIQSFLRGDETLIEYYYHGEDLYAFVLTKNELRAFQLDGRDLSKDTEDLRRRLQEPKSAEYIDLSQRVYQRLIRPISKAIATPKLIIVPHGILHYLPFNALNSGSGYLIDQYSVSYLPSASVMKFLRPGRAQKTGKALILGNPDLGDPRHDLKYAGNEAVAISAELPHARVLLRKEATETNFKRLADQAGTIHFATHGLFESDSPLKSGLLLSRDGENDGLLSVNELYSLRLNADMVVLSACETALGKINAGDDVVGLQRGFLYAGANSIVASLWKVDDLATSELMTGFYLNLKKTNKRDALREAQLAVKKKYEHPYFWAAFQLTGMAD